MGRKNKKNNDDGSINLGGLGGFGDFAGWGDIAEDDEEEDEEEEEEEEEDLPPPPPPPPPAGKGKGKGGKNQPHNAAKGAQQQQKNQKQNQNQNQNQQWNHYEGNQRERQQQQFATNDWGAPKRNGQIPNQNQGNKNNNNNNNNGNNGNNGKNNRNNKKQSRIEEVEEEEEVPPWGSVGGDWYNGAPGEAASGVGFAPGTGTGTGVGPGSMAGWAQQSAAANSDWGAPPPQQSFRRQQDQLASLLHHPRVWTPSVGISDEVRSQLHGSAPHSAHSHPPGGPPSAARQSISANSRTFRHAAGLTPASVLNGGAARNGPHTQVQILDSGGTALKAADKALFGHDRLSNQRVHWMFSPYKDTRVSSLLEWVQAMNHALATVGVHHLLQTQQRGALFTNADFRHWQFTSEPTFDWLTFDDIVDTYDKTLQESIAFYEVENQVLVFIFLLSPSKNSMAVWRRKIVIPNAVRTQNRNELTKVAKSLSKRKFVLTVDNLPRNPASSPEPPKPKRKWFNILG